MQHFTDEATGRHFDNCSIISLAAGCLGTFLEAILTQLFACAVNIYRTR